jgi:hypothetical protein
LAKELLKTSRKQCGGFGKRQSKGLPGLSIALLACTRMAMESLKITKNQCGGIEKRQSKDMLTLSSVSLTCTRMAKEFLKTTRKQRGGIGKRQRNCVLHHSSLLDSFTTVKLAFPKIDKKVLFSSQLRLNRATQAHRIFLRVIVVLLWPLSLLLNVPFVVVVLRTI